MESTTDLQVNNQGREVISRAGTQIDSIISAFERRSLTRRQESYGVLATMLFLLGLATWVFVHAKEITAKETSRNDQSLVLTLQKKKADAAAGINEITKTIPDLLRELGEVRQPSPQHSPAKFNIELANEQGRLREKADVLSELTNDLKRTGYNYIDYEIRLSGNILPSIRLRVSTDTLRQVGAKPGWPQLDFSQTLARLGPLIHDFDIADSAINQIFTTEKNQEVQGLLGKSPDQSNSNLSLPFLVQLNITRFGTISLVAIALGLLSPLYRFSARLAAFYQARADALRIHQITYKDIAIVQIINALTPEFDFGKAEPTEDRLAGLLKLLSAGTKE